MALAFINEFIDNLPGYAIIDDLSIKKAQDAGYSNDDLISISTGKMVGSINVRLEISWYMLKKKTQNPLIK
jgi:hypothetical protein